MKTQSIAVLALALVACRTSYDLDTPEPSIEAPPASGVAEIVDLTVATPAIEDPEGACVVLEDGRARCWGHHPAFRSMMPADARDFPLSRATTIEAPPLRMLRLGPEVAVGVELDGALWIWDEKGVGTRETADRFDDVAVGTRTVCARQSDAIGCWIGADEALREQVASSDPIALVFSEDLPAGPSWMHPRGHVMAIIEDEGIARFPLGPLRDLDLPGDAEVEALQMPAPENVPHPAAWSWTLRDHSGRVEWPSAFGAGVCRLASGRVHCSAGSRLDPARIDDDGPEARIAARGATHFAVTAGGTLCVATGSRLACEGEAVSQMRADIVRLQVVVATGLLTITTVDGSTWVKKPGEKGPVEPRNEDDARSPEKPADERIEDPAIRSWVKAHDVLRVVDSERGPCGVLENGSLECSWAGSESESERVVVRVPEGFHAVDLQAFDDRLCARTEGGEVACWSARPEAAAIGRLRRTWVDLTDWVLAD